MVCTELVATVELEEGEYAGGAVSQWSLARGEKLLLGDGSIIGGFGEGPDNGFCCLDTNLLRLKGILIVDDVVLLEVEVGARDTAIL